MTKAIRVGKADVGKNPGSSSKSRKVRTKASGKTRKPLERIPEPSIEPPLDPLTVIRQKVRAFELLRPDADKANAELERKTANERRYIQLADKAGISPDGNPGSVETKDYRRHVYDPVMTKFHAAQRDIEVAIQAAGLRGVFLGGKLYLALGDEEYQRRDNLGLDRKGIVDLDPIAKPSLTPDLLPAASARPVDVDRCLDLMALDAIARYHETAAIYEAVDAWPTTESGSREDTLRQLVWNWRRSDEVNLMRTILAHDPGASERNIHNAHKRAFPPRSVILNGTVYCLTPNNYADGCQPYCTARNEVLDVMTLSIFPADNITTLQPEGGAL